MEAKRYHPLLLIFQLKTIIRNSFIIVIYLFLINGGSENTFYTYLRYIFLIVIGFSILSVLYKWLTHKYKLDQGSFQLYKGIFSKSRHTIPFSKVQNVHRHTSWLHWMLSLTSITFETNMEDKEDSVTFQAVTPAEADRMEEIVKEGEREQSEEPAFSDQQEPAEETSLPETVHFKPGIRDHVKASIMSLSFFALVPVGFSLLSNLDSVDFLSQLMENTVTASLVNAWWKIALLVLAAAAASLVFGAVRTILQYGRYEIVSDAERIHITKGLLNATSFSVLKNKVQAVECRQPPVSRWLGITEVRLISAGGMNAGNDTQEINTLYPYLSVTRAYTLIEEILPAFAVTETMRPLPRRSLALRLIRPSWLWLIATGLLVYFKPSLFGLELPWWVFSGVLLGLVITSRLLDFFHTRYTVNDECIQWKKGGWTTFLFLTRREKITEMAFKRGVLQQKTGLSSVKTINRAHPVKHTDLDDIPAEWSRQMQGWYSRRPKKINPH